MADDDKSGPFLAGFIFGGLVGAVATLILISLSGGKINLNTATAEELESLPGIGPTYAQRIMEKRPFASIEEIKKVRGIGEVALQRLKALIAVG